MITDQHMGRHCIAGSLPIRSDYYGSLSGITPGITNTCNNIGVAARLARELRQAGNWLRKTWGAESIKP